MWAPFYKLLVVISIYV